MDGDGGGHHENADEEVGHRQTHHEAVGNGAQTTRGQNGQNHQSVANDGDHNKGGEDSDQTDALPGDHQVIEVGPFRGRRRFVIIIKGGHGGAGSVGGRH